MAHPLKLNCLVLGHRNNVFQITLAPSQRIAELEAGIKEKKKPAFDQVPASDLVLWEVSVRLDDKLKQNLESLTFVKEKRLFPPFKELGDIFSPEDGYLHVVVQPTIFELNCLVDGDPLNCIFPVKIVANKSVGFLKDDIKEEKKPAFDRVPADTLVLWKDSVSIHGLPEKPSDVNFPHKMLLSPVDILSEVFSGIPKEGHLHIVVKQPTIEEMAVTDGGAEERRDEIGALHNRFQSLVWRLNVAGPSEPRPRVTPPIQLFHPAFGQFLDTISNTNIIPHSYVIQKTVEYMRSAGAIYPDAKSRTAKLTARLGDILDVNIQTIMNEDEMDAYGTVKWVLKGGILLLLIEDKNESGDGGGCDLLTQAGLSAASHWAQHRFERIRNSTSCPTFLIATAGPYIAVLGVIITDIVVAQLLTDRIWVGFDTIHNPEPHITNVARIFFALTLSVKHLGVYYKNLKPSGPLPLDSRYFPSITAYTGTDGDGLVNFKYVGYLENGPDCITLRARTCAEPAKDIVVKFVECYGDRAHHLLVDEGLAPKLWYYGPPGVREGQPSYHSLFMVVMEYIEGQTFATVKADMDQDAIARVRSGVERALGLLHKGGYVFGDLRSSNIMVEKTGEVKLIDFDWAGVQGQVKYPYLMSSDIQWPEGVELLKFIKEDHDQVMFNKLFHVHD